MTDPPAPGDPRAASAAEPFSSLVPAIIGGALMMQTLNATVVANALPTMARSLHEDPIRLNAAITVYLLAGAVCLPISGWVADRFWRQAGVHHRDHRLRERLRRQRLRERHHPALACAHVSGRGRRDDGPRRPARAAARDAAA